MGPLRLTQKTENAHFLPLKHKDSRIVKLQQQQMHAQHGQRRSSVTHKRAIRSNSPRGMAADTDQSRRVTFANNLSVGGPRQKAETQVKLHLTLS